MTTAAPRISPRLLAALVRLDDRAVPIAETCRRVCEEADRLGLVRPSYQQVRVLVHRERGLRGGPSTLDVLLDVTTRRRAPEALLDHAAGIQLPGLDR